MGTIDRPSMLRLLAPLLLLGSVLQGALLAPAKAHQPIRSKVLCSISMAICN